MTRLPAPFGTRIDRARPVTFRFEGRPVTGYAGDTIASALAASGQLMLSRSFKYHRPRGAFGLAGAEANTLVQVGAEPNVQADLRRVSEGMVVTAQNVAGSLAFDRDAAMGLLSRFLPVGFYYRTFMGPTRHAWYRLWEPLIRAKAGLGRVDPAATFPPGPRGNLHCDVLVVGAGPAGLAAAAEAARGGADTILCDAGPEAGGTLCHAPGPDGGAGLLAAVAGVRVMTATTCTGWFADNWLALVQAATHAGPQSGSQSASHAASLWRVRARQVVFAVGGIEQPALFRNNDLPGVLSSGAVRRLIRLYGVAPGRSAVVLAGTPEGLDAAEDLRAAGIALAAVVLPRPLPGHEARIAALGAPVIAGRIEAAAGRGRVARVQVAGRWIDCDTVAVAVGQAPGAVLGHDTATGRFTLRLDRPGLHLAGSVNGHAGHAAVIADGRHAAHAALRALGLADGAEGRPKDPDAALAFWHQPVEPHPKGKDFVDFDEDLTVADLVNAVAEGYRELELVKRFTTVGMGPSQGRHSALATARVVAQATGRAVAEVGVATARPPAMPEALGTLAGHAHTAERRTALHARHLALGAEMRPVGAWWRPYLYGRGDRAALIAAEVAAVRQGVGLLDVSTLGKLEVRGPDAGEFLDRLYTMAHRTQPVGRVRYCLMLNDLGAVVDDGVALRLADDHFFVTATTGAVARVYADMAHWNAQWGLRVDVANVTGAFAGLNVTGPGARAVVQALGGDIDFSAAGFPYLSGCEGVVAGVPVRAMRIGFTGELSYEFHCPASLAPALWDAVMAVPGVRPYGLEASRILRLEKGHILIGQDTDALSSPDELSMGWALSGRKPFHVGKRSVEMRRRLGVARKLAAVAFPPGTRGVEESCLVLDGGRPAGHVTSAALSPTLGHPIALAFVPAALAVPGTAIAVRARGGAVVTGQVAGHAFYDPDNTRQEVAE
jgi:sarcosine oxidase subunit alpha